MKKKIILIMGLPGSGKTTLARELKKITNASWLNADVVRKKYNDYDFSLRGTVRQAKRMFKLAKQLSKKKHVIVDFICPTPLSFKHFKADYIIWMDTIKKGRFEIMNKMFKKPKNFNLRIKNKNAKKWSKIIKKNIFSQSGKDIHNTAIILCGGKGSRLGILGKKLPKTLVKVNNKPILWFIINSLIQNSFNHFILPTGYKGTMIKRYINKNFSNKKINIQIVQTGIDSNIAKRINKIKNNIISDNFLLLNGDAIFDFNLKKIFENHKKKECDITFIGCHAPLNYGVISFKGKKIVNFVREMNFNTITSSKINDIKAYVYSGMSIMNKKILKINFSKFNNFEKELYPLTIKKFKSDFCNLDGFWYSIDNMKDLESIKKKNNNNNFKIIKNLEKKIKNHE
tara:strand:- start:7520 stop:8716 length:1197 start_codon:yes stop_codon:yes gene_type:complete